MPVFRQHFIAFVLTFAAFVLLTLITFSVPFVSPLYFLHSSISGGVQFGVWGWCLDSGDVCSPKSLGYEWSPQIVFWLTKSLVTFPVSAGLCLVSLLSLIPTLCSHRRDRIYPSPIFSFLSLISFLASLVGFAFLLALCTIASMRFHRDGFTGTFGPVVWMSLAAMLVLMFVSLSGGCGGLCRGRCGRTSPFTAYNV